ncbi:MAG TPA: SPFH domain-containing protein [Phycisphaerales bacterium]|nr:SPFH domain-containing protein [Phycisphaerales bacterium]
MGIWDRLKHELIDIIQYLDDTQNTMVFRFERFQNEIKYGAKLVVREGQAAVFINEGKLADVFKPGTYTLTTQNLPILATLLGWKYGFESPFKAEVYFVSTRTFTDLKWGTLNPVMLRDPEFGPVRLRAFGNYTMRVSDPGTFIRTIVGTEGRYTTDEITNQLRNLIVSEFADILGESKIPMLDLASNYSELGKFLTEKMSPEFAKYGLELPKLNVENISLPPEVEAALDKRSSMSVIGNLDSYTKFQTAEAIRDAAKNPGAAGGFIGMGLGGNFAGAMGQQMAGAGAAAMGGPGTPPPMGGGAAVAGYPFFLAIGGKQAGPFEFNLLRSKVMTGELKPETLVWRAGMPTWAAAKDVPELTSVLASGSPPPPMP